MVFKDQLNREITIDTGLKRIISLVPSQTELLVDLGLGSKLVGVTKFCVHPRDLKTNCTVVGGTKQVKLEKIKALQPDIILCNKEENTKEMVKDLSLIAPVFISDVGNFESALGLINAYGQLFACETNANQLIHDIKQEEQNLARYLSNYPYKRAAYMIWKDPWMVAGGDTFIEAMLKRAGFENVFTGTKRYPEVNLDNPLFKDCDVILLSSEPYPFTKKHQDELNEKFPDIEIKLVDGEMFSWFGSRMRLAFPYFLEELVQC